MKKHLKYILLVMASALLVPVMPGASLLACLGMVAITVGLMLFGPKVKGIRGVNRAGAPDFTGGVSVELENGQLGGTVDTGDGITGKVLTGVDEGDYVAGTVIVVSGMTSLKAAGITKTDNPFAYKEVSEFYSTAPVGTQLYLMLVPNTMTIADICDKTNEDGLIKLMLFANGKVSVVSAMTDDKAMLDEDEDSVTNTDGINDDIAQAINNLHDLLEDFAAMQMPARGLIGATSFTGDYTDLTDLKTLTKNRVGLVIGDTDTTYSNKGACLGLALGRVAAIPVQRKVSRRKDGSLPNTKAYLGAIDVKTIPLDPAYIKALGYITMISVPRKEGYYFTGDHMCADDTDDYVMMARGRVIDKVHKLACEVYADEVDDEVPVTPEGKIEPGFARHLEQQMENMVAATMAEEISDFNAFIDTNQNVLSTNKTRVVLEVTPVGYNSSIEVKLGFNNPALAS